MKRIFLLLGLCLCLTACGGCGGQSDEPGMTNTDTKDAITLGMTREEVGETIDQKLNTPWVDEDAGDGTMLYGDSAEATLSVLYQDNKVIGMLVDDTINDADTSQWTLPEGITKGSTLEEITAAYGENPDANGEGMLFTYTFAEEGYEISLMADENGLRAYALMAAAGE